jgi:hypothetical protein
MVVNTSVWVVLLGATITAVATGLGAVSFLFALVFDRSRLRAVFADQLRAGGRRDDLYGVR